MGKEKKYGESEYKVTRIVVTTLFVVLIAIYFLYFMLGGKGLPLVSSIIIFLIGILLFIFGLTIYQQRKKIELGYDETVVWKLCVSSGVICVIVSFIILFTMVIFK